MILLLIVSLLKGLALLMPPAPIVSTCPLKVNPLPLGPKRIELNFHGRSTCGEGRDEATKVPSADPSFAGAPTGYQFCAVLQLLSAPFPLHVTTAPRPRSA